MAFFSNLKNSVNSAADAVTARVDSLNIENSKLKSDKKKLTRKFEQLDGTHSKLKNEINELTNKTSLLQGQLIESKKKSKIVASHRFRELKSQYLKKIELIDTREELLNKQNRHIRDNETLITKNKKIINTNSAEASKHARELLYNNKDLVFYNTVTNIFKFILLIISIAIIFLLLKR